MDVVSVAGAPVARDVLSRAVASEDRELADPIAFMRATHLMQVLPAGARGAQGGEAVDVYHDRIRATVLGRLEAGARRALHERLARALETGSGDADAEALATHWRGGGDLERAAQYYATAADQAVQALAFERAARLYRLALTLKEPAPDDDGALSAKLGGALVNTGRGALAARAFQTAAERAPAARALELRRRAAEQLLRAGHFDEGLAAIGVVLSSSGMRLPATPLIALALFLLWRAYLRLRGLGFRERDASQVSAAHLLRVDTCWSVAMGLAMVDNIRGATFQARHLALALSVGEPVRVARALALEVGYVARGGGASWPHTEALMARAMRLAERTRRPDAIGFATATAGFAHHLGGKFRRGLELLDRGLAILRDECSGMSWEIASVQSNVIMCLAHLGELAELCRRRTLYIRDGVERGDLYAVVNLRIGSPNIAWLVHDDPDEARAECQDAMRRWSKQGFHVEHYLALVARVNADLYSGQGAAAHAMTSRQWPSLRRSLLLTVQVVRISSHWARGRCALAAAAQGGAAGRAALHVAAVAARALERERWGWSVPMATQLLAGIAMVGAGDGERARHLLERAVVGFEREDMAMHAAAARHRLGRLVGGEEGRALVEAAETWMAGQGVRAPGRLAGVFAPGFESAG
jgi:tetratricopeptide (TPR) repeat protein